MASDGSNTGTPEKTEKSRAFAPKQIVATVLIVLAVILGFENTQQVRLQLIVPHVTTHLWILVAAPLILGLLAGLLLGHKSRKSK